MSYDIRFGVKVAGAEDVYAVIGHPEYDSPTYNLHEIFEKSMDWDYSQGEWYPIKEIIPKIERGIHELRSNPYLYKQYEPDNGWGTVQSALNTLESIHAWFFDDVWMKWDTEIPLECIYMRW